ncbi:MAG: co-chaperone GroES [Candidatus Omnitrophica bacterium]|nr:co-chaperone GroES [Candidatus Omnitrophota bacterium]
MPTKTAEWKATSLKPIGDKVIVEPLESGERTKGGIYLPDTAKEKPQEGKVIAVGSGKTLDNGRTVAPEVKAGDRIIYSKFSGNEVRIDDQEYLIVNADDILAIIK